MLMIFWYQILFEHVSFEESEILQKTSTYAPVLYLHNGDNSRSLLEYRSRQKMRYTQYTKIPKYFCINRPIIIIERDIVYISLKQFSFISFENLYTYSLMYFYRYLYMIKFYSFLILLIGIIILSNNA